jgi:hypothetical protein
VQVDVAGLGLHQVEEIGPVEAVDLDIESELVEYLAGGLGEPCEIGVQLVGDVGGVVENALEG